MVGGFAGDVGVVLLLTPPWSERGGQGRSVRLCLLRRHGDDWHYLGGGGGPTEDYPLEPVGER